MNPSATIRLFLPFGDPKKIRTAEISNWSGKAIAAPRTDLDLLLPREELSKPGIYFLLGVDALDGRPMAYIGEAETVSSRIKQHKSKEFWSSVIVFVSKDDNLTKAHIRYLEGRLIDGANKIGRSKVENFQSSGARLPESDQHEMEVFLERITQLLPILGSEILTPILQIDPQINRSETLICLKKGARATGMRVPNGFVVFAGSTAIIQDRESAKVHGQWILDLRERLKLEKSLVELEGFYKFTRDVEFSSPSAAAGVIFGGNAPGPIAWKNADGITLKELDEVTFA